MGMNCRVCEKSEGKYKCPTCEAPYCSIPCYKTHKESPCEKAPEEPEKPAQEQRTLLFTTMDTVPLENLEKLRHSEALKKLLHNPHLRSYLKDLDSATNPSFAIQSAMMEPLFLEFADECLKVVEPSEEKYDSS